VSVDALGVLQRRTAAALLSAAPFPKDVLALVKPSATLDAAARLDVYRRMIDARFCGVVENDFPATRAALGPARFDAVARAYVASRPSRSFTLDGYASEFPAFLAVSNEEAAAELARYESALDAARDVLESPPLDRAALAATPMDAWPMLRFRFVPGFALFRSNVAVETSYAAWLRGRPTSPPSLARPTFVLLFRARGGTKRLRIGARACVFVEALRVGATLGEATTRARKAGLRAAEIGRLCERLVASGALFSVGRSPVRARGARAAADAKPRADRGIGRGVAARFGGRGDLPCSLLRSFAPRYEVSTPPPIARASRPL
jgi:hypothetical protein